MIFASPLDASFPSSSCTPVTVTVCSVSQLEDVNVRLLLSRLKESRCPKSLSPVTDTPTVTSAVGCVASLTSRSAVLPSVTDSSESGDGSTTRPGRTSSSITVTVTETSARPL